MIKLSLKKLQPNWPSDEEISSKLSSIRRNNHQNWPAPNKRILKEVWLKGLPITANHILNINPEIISNNSARSALGFLDLFNYLKRNNPTLEFTRENTLAIIHVAFNIVSLIRKSFSNSILFDYIKCENTINNIVIKKIFPEQKSLLIIDPIDVEYLFNCLDTNSYNQFWNRIETLLVLGLRELCIPSELPELIPREEYRILFSNRHRRYPAKRSGFCRECDHVPEEENIQWTYNENSNDFRAMLTRSWNLVNDSRSVFGETIEAREEIPEERRIITNPINSYINATISFEVPRNIEPLDPKLEECIRILNEGNISESTRLSVYELILANES